MAKTIQEDFLYKKTYEFSYAVFRIASSAKNREIADLIESKAFLLLDSVISGDYSKTRDIMSSITSLTALMVDGGFLNPINRDVLIRESENVYSGINALPKKKELLPDLNLAKVFSKSLLPIKRQTSLIGRQIADRIIADKIAEQNIQSEIKHSELEIADKGIDEQISAKSDVRQSAIMTKLQETANLPDQQAGCRLNELQAILPGISERTLRYDLESLISSGLVERIGSRRNSFYKLKTHLDNIIELPSPRG